AKECGNICKNLLVNNELREQIRAAGMERVRTMRVGNEEMCKDVLEVVFQNFRKEGPKQYNGNLVQIKQ
ncbi:MAG TPA: hypothetical protein VEZ17_18705, partial [Chitinophagaceae bacterium]|nr:hypothetical protein [Chitinophagaceae bacterium]